ncbi:unnamed protein product [Adineta ricciae]|uniref:Uncharacterized protein n=1 Tax=Adineta ricciae TaxID=249248 RepID=A0A814T0S3_ADIRI|nr:unnamed protein product [Adineta ricciae]CAF1155169.1 unnamed protein product [Adineta ricciae]
MASQLFSRTRPINFDANPSPDTMYHLPMSPSEPGKFDFYRVHLANQASQTHTDNSDTPTLSASSSTATRRWTPFANIAPPDQSKGFLSTNTSSLNSTSSTRSLIMPAMDSSVTSNTNRSQTEPIPSTSSFSSLTDIVKNAMNKKPSTTNVQPVRRLVCGTTLSTKDLNHLSPQSA